MTNNTELSQKLSLSLSPELYQLLEKLAENNNTDIANVIINGIALFGIAEEEAKQKGYKLGIIDGNRIIKEIEIDLTSSWREIPVQGTECIRDNLRKLSRCQENSKSDWGRMGKERLTLS